MNVLGSRATQRTWSLRAIALALLVLGLAWTDCILVATAAAIAAAAHAHASAQRAPREGWRVACGCWATTLVYLGVGLALVLMVVATGFEHWGSSAATFPRMTSFAVAVGSAIALLAFDRPRNGLVGLSAIAVVGGTLLLWQPAGTGCIVALAVVAGLCARAWYLSRVLAPFVLRNDQRF
jgi:hypothetical protein